MSNLFLGLIAVPALIVLVYVCVRVASYAHFRTRLEFIKRLTTEEIKDGETK